MHDVDLSQRLHFAESDFLTALESGTKMLTSYHRTWSSLPNDLSSASENGTTGNETLSLIHFAASRISNIASCYLDVQQEEESFTSQLRNDCDAMLHHMSVLNLDTQPKYLHPDSTPRPPTHLLTSTLNAESPSPPFFAPAYRWLLDNLHNPYPSAEVKARFAAASSCQISSINSWFINARRRIGWTSLCRERFFNCRANMIDAAYRALVKEEPRRMLSPEVTHSFIAMKVAAEDLYSSTFAKSAVAVDLDVVVKDMTDEDRRLVEHRKCRQAEETKFAKDLGRETRTSHVSGTQNLLLARDPYPSPDRSMKASPVPALDDSLTDESEEEEDVVPPTIAGSKRRRPSMEPANQLSSTAMRPIKRLRTSITCGMYLPSPPSGTDGVDDPSEHGSRELSPAHSTQSDTNKVSPPRKRRLSDTDVVGTLKRPRGVVAGPHFHAASDPLPRSDVENECSIDDWFNTNFDTLFAIPPPVDATEPDFFASLEVELFSDYNIPRDPGHVLRCPPAPTEHTQISAPTDLSDLDNLLQSIGGDTFATPPESAPLSDVTGAPHTRSLDSSIPDMSIIDWTSLLNCPDVHGPSIYPTFPQYPADSQPLPEIDFSMLQLPHVMPAVNSQADFASKQAKLHQLYAMQEAVRQTEQELQAEGVVM